MKERETLPLSEDKEKNFRMIDVGSKMPTHRRAIAQGKITVGKEAFGRIVEKNMPKGDVLAMAEVAGIMGAKGTAQLLPLCHPLPIESVSVWFEKEELSFSFWAFCEVSATAKTGVEMEALAGVQTALLSIYDLTKGIEPALSISEIRLNRKEGGKKGVWIHPECPSNTDKKAEKQLVGIKTGTLTISDRSYRGEREDLSGEVMKRYLNNAGAEVVAIKTVSDSEEAIIESVLEISLSAQLILTSGGTGLGPRDVTIAALKKISTKEVPGFGELIRNKSAVFTDKSWLSGAGAFVVKQTLVLALPGSPKAVDECLGILNELLPHAIHISGGGDHG